MQLMLNPVVARELTDIFILRTESNVTHINFSQCAFVLDELFHIKRKPLFPSSGLTIREI